MSVTASQHFTRLVRWGLALIAMPIVRLDHFQKILTTSSCLAHPAQPSAVSMSPRRPYPSPVTHSSAMDRCVRLRSRTAEKRRSCRERSPAKRDLIEDNIHEVKSDSPYTSRYITTPICGLREVSSYFLLLPV